MTRQAAAVREARVVGEPGSRAAVRPGDGTHHPSPSGNLRWDPSNGAPLDAVVARAQEAGFTITMPAHESGSYAIGNWPDVEGRPRSTARPGTSCTAS